MTSKDDQLLRRFMPFPGAAPVVRLKQGEVFFDPAPHRLATLLGSCVAVCLWDQRKRMGGMTHSLIPGPEALRGRPGTEFYATDRAVEELVRRMQAAGCRTEDMIAKLFGGFAPMRALKSGMGSANIKSAIRILYRLSIDVVASEVLEGGGMIIYMDSESGEVRGRRIDPL